MNPFLIIYRFFANTLGWEMFYSFIATIITFSLIIAVILYIIRQIFKN